MIPIHYLHLLAHRPGEFLAEESATQSGSVIKQVSCETCGFDYKYQLRRTARGYARPVLTIEDARERAHYRARKELERALREDCDPVPCPACGWYQRHMIPRAKQLRHRWMAQVGLLLFPVSAILSAILLACGALFADIFARQWSLVSVIAFLSLAGSALAFALALGLPMVRFVLGRLYDPNAADVETRKRLGRERVIAFGRNEESA